MTKKRLLTIDDLVKFCSEQKFTKFSAKESGYRIAVQIPTTFEVSENSDDDHRGMIKIKCRVLLEGKNRNGSYISKDSADDAAPTIKDRPLLAYIHQLDSGEWDFESHNMNIIENEDGETEIEYVEKQIGSFSNEEPFWETDEDTKLNYLCAYAWIPEEYTKAANILRRKNGFSKSSCELSIEEMSFQAKEKYLSLDKYFVSAVTLLGSHDDGTQVNEGMQGAGVEIVDFSEQNNSVFTQNAVMEKLEEINEKLSALNINNSEGKEENQVDENVMETNEQEIVEEVQVEESAEEVATEESAEETPTEDFVEDSEVATEEKFSKTFELSHDDIRVALYALLSANEEADNEWYWISDVYDDHFVYEGWCNPQNIYDQKYTKDGDNIAFEGDRIHMNKELLTDNELAQLNAMRSNYEELQSKLQKYEDEPKKLEILESEEFSLLAGNEDFNNLKKKENYFDLSVDEVRAKADEILLNAAKAGSVNFEAKTENKTSYMKLPTDKPARTSRYGGLFKKN